MWVKLHYVLGVRNSINWKEGKGEEDESFTKLKKQELPQVSRKVAVLGPILFCIIIEINNLT